MLTRTSTIVTLAYPLFVLLSRPQQTLGDNTMGIGNIFVATTLAPLVVVLASMSLQLFAIGLEQLKKCELGDAPQS